ncbi:hypothetical protein niasHT_020113 [Heterodera trifolii]|uniref:Uncharacterized protein n=1 Tax=Heterodera trifolii TaxID=157864 RepID=A0ABD2LJN5_9BILA
MSDNGKEAEEKMAKAIFISGDGWLAVFDLLAPSQLGLGIAMISHRFDFYVDEHFKTRKWALKFIGIQSKIGENGTKQMEILNLDQKSLPIPQIQLPRKVIGFRSIVICSFNFNVIAFLHRFRPLFAACPINLEIKTTNDGLLEFILHNFWPMIAKNIRGMDLFSDVFHCLRKFAPSILNDCSSLRFFFDYGEIFAEFPFDDSAMASDGQALAKWLFTPLPNNVPKVFNCWSDSDPVNWPSNIAAFKAAFANASSPVNFIVVIWFRWSFADSVVPFDQTNELTREQLTLKRTDDIRRFLLVRCPIARDASKWAKWEEETIGWKAFGGGNDIVIPTFRKDKIGEKLLGVTPGPSDQQK